jgi:hypothetical protein
MLGGVESIAPTRTRSRNNVASKNQKWTPEEDARLHEIVRESATMNWKAAEPHFPGKTSQQIFERWTKVLNPSLHKGSWTRQEDELIIAYVRSNGCKAWTKLAKMLPGRIGKQCRERWFNHLDPQISRDPWTPEEDQLLMHLHKQYGNHWSQIAALMPTRADNMIKNRWYSTLAKRSTDEVTEDVASYSEKAVRSRPPPIQVEGLPQPVIEDPIPNGEIWTLGFGSTLGLTPVPFSVTPSMNASNGLISPIVPGVSPFGLISPYGKATAMMSPWGEFPKTVFGSPGKTRTQSLSENRVELVNLISHQ